jgi:hypothetical protein
VPGQPLPVSLSMRSAPAQGSPTLPACGVVLAAIRRNHFPIATKLSGNNHPLAFAPIKHPFSVKLCSECFMSSSFHNADRRTYRKVMLVGLLFCAAFVVFSFFAREQPANTYVLKKADRLVRSAGSAAPAN